MNDSSDDKGRARFLNAVLDRVNIDSLVGQVDFDEHLARIDVNELLDRVDVNRLLDQVDVNRLLDQVAVDRLLDQVAVDRLLDRVDVHRLLDRLDLNRLLDQVQVDRLLDQVDINRLLDQVDVDRALDRVDVDRLLGRVDLNRLVDRQVDVNRLLEQVDVDRLLDRVEVDRLLDQVAVNRLLDQVAVDRLLDRVDVHRLLDRLDFNRLLDQVQVDRLLDQVDINRLLDQVDVDSALDRVDVDRLLDRVDLNRLVDRLDVETIARRANVGGLVAESTSQVAGSTLDVARRQAVGLDTLVMGLVDRLLRRNLSEQPLGPPELISADSEIRPASSGAPRRSRISGYYAGPLSRVLAYLIDSFVVFSGAGLISAIVVGSINVVLGAELEWDWRAGVLGLVAFSVWAFVYLWVGVAISGRTIGMSVVGVKVVEESGAPVSPFHAALRSLTLPISVISVLGVLSVIFDPKQRAIHDWIAKTAVIYDWGDRPAELPAPLSKWLTDHGVSDVSG